MIPDKHANYVNNGRGYELQSTDDLTADERLVIKKQAFPSGNLWEHYIGAEGIKAFSLPSGLIAVSQIKVTNQTDFGRKGVLDAKIDILRPAQYQPYLEALLNKIIYQYDLDDNHIPSNAGRIFINYLLGRQTIFKATYRNPYKWQLINASIIKSVLRLPTWLSTRISFTTFTLSESSDSQIIGVPTAQIAVLNLQGKTLINMDNYLL
jgi:hypothetical protein